MYCCEGCCWIDLLRVIVFLGVGLCYYWCVLCVVSCACVFVLFVFLVLFLCWRRYVAWNVYYCTSVTTCVGESHAQVCLCERESERVCLLVVCVKNVCG